MESARHENQFGVHLTFCDDLSSLRSGLDQLCIEKLPPMHEDIDRAFFRAEDVSSNRTMSLSASVAARLFKKVMECIGGTVYL